MPTCHERAPVLRLWHCCVACLDLRPGQLRYTLHNTCLRAALAMCDMALGFVMQKTLTLHCGSWHAWQL